jgi:transcriptional regulator with XRE-family HTH domain
MLFGKLISDARKRANLSQKELAALIRKEDGEPISAQYLNDIEKGRRNPPSDFLLKQFAEILHIDIDVLYFRAGEIPEDLRDKLVSEDTIVSAYRLFRRKIEDDA